MRVGITVFAMMYALNSYTLVHYSRSEPNASICCVRGVRQYHCLVFCGGAILFKRLLTMGKSE